MSVGLGREDIRAKAAEIGIDTLAARLRDDAVANDRVIFLPRLVGAWARLTDA